LSIRKPLTQQDLTILTGGSLDKYNTIGAQRTEVLLDLDIIDNRNKELKFTGNSESHTRGVLFVLASPTDLMMGPT